MRVGAWIRWIEARMPVTRDAAAQREALERAEVLRRVPVYQDYLPADFRFGQDPANER